MMLLFSCTNDMVATIEETNTDVISPSVYQKPFDFYLFIKESGGEIKYSTDTTTHPPSPKPYLSFYKSSEFRNVTLNVNISDDSIVINNIDTIFKNIEICMCDDLKIQPNVLYEYKRGVTGYLSLSANLIGDSTKISGNGHETIYLSNLPAKNKIWYLSTEPMFFESEMIKEMDIAGSVTVNGTTYKGLTKTYTSSVDWYLRGDTIKINKEKLDVMFDDTHMHIQLGEFKVSLPKEFITYEGRDLIYNQNRNPGGLDPYLVSYIKAHIKHIDGKIDFYFEDHVWNTAGVEPTYTKINVISE